MLIVMEEHKVEDRPDTCPVCNTKTVAGDLRSSVYIWNCDDCGDYWSCIPCAKEDSKRHVKERKDAEAV